MALANASTEPTMRIDKNPSAWGTRAQLGATMKELADLKGNKDGIWGNETEKKGSTGNVFERNPGALAVKNAFSTGISTKDEIQQLADYVSSVEAKAGRPVLSPGVDKELKSPGLFAAQKSIALERIGRDPTTITDKFIDAKGSVDGERISDRRVFTQHFPPTGTPTGNVVVVSPGFLETGRTFYEQIDALNKAGHDVVVMDHQWAGQSQGSPGGIDRGFGIARDTAAVTAYAAELQREKYGDKAGSVAILGNSMGAGPGAFGAALLNDAGKIQLDGPEMPKGVDLVLQAPFFGATDSVINDVLGGAAKLPFLNKLQAPALGLPDLTDDTVAEHKVSQGQVLEDVRGQFSAFRSSDADLKRLQKLVDDGARPQGKVILVQTAGDTLADPVRAQKVADQIGAEKRILSGDNHVLSLSPSEQGAAVDAVNDILVDEE
jgi:pimeloyl-ACP methyl ester carboxylesterase